MLVRFFFLLLFAILISNCAGSKQFKLAQEAFLAGRVGAENYHLSIPFTQAFDLPIIQVKVNGKTCRFMVDTGAPNVISKELAAELGLEAAGRLSVGDINGKSQYLSIAYLDSLSIQGLSFYGTGTLIADLQQSTEVSCLGVDGFLGSNLMRKGGIWQFDYQNQRIRLASHRDSLTLGDSLLVLDFQTSTQGTPRLDLDLYGIPVERADLDTGSNGELSVTSQALPKVRARNALFPQTRSYGYANSGLYGRTTDTITTCLLEQFAIDSIPFGPVVVEFETNSTGTIGGGFLEHFVSTIDWQTNELLLEPLIPIAATTSTYGFSPALVDGQLQVGLLWEDSPASRAGLEVGDRILFFNGQDFVNPLRSSYCNLLLDRRLQNGTAPIQLFIEKEGKTVEVKLEKQIFFEQEGS
jgi:predicted aspartyl protease